jgi:polyvinyl alcohol dehydrogenase (cytochrome)
MRARRDAAACGAALALFVISQGAVAEAVETAAARAPETNLCAEPAQPLALGSAQWNGWGRDIENTRYQPEPALRAIDVPRLGLKWAFGFSGSVVAGQPTVVDGRLFVLSAIGRVYSLDATTGCTYWTFDAAAGTHGSIFIGELGPLRKVAVPRPPAQTQGKLAKGKGKGKGKKGKHAPLTDAHVEVLKAPTAAFFGDDSGSVYALDAQKGTLLWKTQVDSHPLARITGAPTLFHDRLYVVVNSSEQSAAEVSTYACCTFRGSIAALDMTSGRLLWKTYAIPEEPRPLAKRAADAQQWGPAGAAITTAPTVDAKRNLLYVGTGGSLTSIDQRLSDAVLAVDMTDGALRWAKQFARHEAVGAAAFMSSPILRTLADGRQLVLAAQKSGIVYAVDPDHGGEVVWQSKAGEGAALRGIEWGPAADHRSLYVALSGQAAEPENASGALEAIDMKTGIRRWYTAAPTPACSWGAQACSHAEAQAVTVIPGIAFSGSMDGHLRAYSTIDGKIVWDYDTAKDFVTINGIKASGGTLDQGGATIVNGVLYINSGYGQRSGQPGNVLLAFSVGKQLLKAQ